MALCPELDIANQGDTIEEARKNLTEAIELFFETAGPLEITRRVIHLYAQSKYCGDLTRHKTLNHRKLVSKDSSGYPYCQKLAEHFRLKGAQILRAPSARDEKGFGIPIFNKEVIQKDFGHLKYVKCELKKNSVKVFPEGETYKLD